MAACSDVPSPSVPKRRPWWFHCAANTVFALVAGLPVMLTAEDRQGWMLLLALLFGFVLIPLSRRWERNRLHQGVG